MRRLGFRAWCQRHPFLTEAVVGLLASATMGAAIAGFQVGFSFAFDRPDFRDPTLVSVITNAAVLFMLWFVTTSFRRLRRP